jgi:hypothetical protein
MNPSSCRTPVGTRGPLSVGHMRPVHRTEAGGGGWAVRIERYGQYYITASGQTLGIGKGGARERRS